jgi:acetoin utilization deacetylase AcuC-like enzyme
VTRCPVVTHPDCVHHDPRTEFWLGMSTPGTEVAERVSRIEQAVQGAGHPMVPATAHDDGTLLQVHDHHLVEHLRTAWESWTAGGYPQLGADRVVPYFFPGDEVRHGLPARIPTAVHAQVGTYCYDTMTTLGPGSWEAIRGAVDAALTAVDLVVAGTPLAYALTRPPGHHATRRGYGGSCYLNNAAIAAQALRDAGHDRVVIVDIDAHHGNGTQALFYDRDDVLYASVHVDPGAGWFPHVVGFADETGRGPGTGANLNVPLPPGSGDTEWLDAVQHCTEVAANQGATALVVSLGVDAAADDPESPLQVSADGYHGAGTRLGRLGLPTVAVQEGGYHLMSLGGLVLATLTGLAEAR